VDAVNAQTPIPGTAACECGCHEHHDEQDHFLHMHPDTCWMSALEHGEKLGIGTREYELIKI